MATTLRPGDPAPSFTAPDQDGNTVSLEDFRGRKLALYFYPHDDTPTCTKEACNLRDGYAALQQAGIEVVGVSTDAEAKHRKFRLKYKLPFTLLADPDKKIVTAYGVWGPKLFMGLRIVTTHRITFLINEQGVIDAVIDPVKSGRHADQILERWQR